MAIPPPLLMALPTSPDELRAALFNAACLWEAAESMASRADAFGHDGAKDFIAREGACAARETIAALALEVEAAWNSLSDDARDGWACPFDWEFCPAWLARRMGWEAGDPCEDPCPDRLPYVGQPLPGFTPRNRTGKPELGRVAFHAEGKAWAVDDVDSNGGQIAFATLGESVRILPDRGRFILSDAQGRFARHERRGNRKPPVRRFRTREEAAAFLGKPHMRAAAWEGGPA